MKTVLAILNFLVHLFSAFGLLWLIVEITAFFTDQSTADSIKPFWWVFLLLGLGYAIFCIVPKQSYKFKVPDRDSNIIVTTRDLFKISGSIIVPINNKFLVNQDGKILDSNSILSQSIRKYYASKPNLLQGEINAELASDFYKASKINQDEYQVGTVVPIKISGKQIYLLANTKLNSNNKSFCDDEMFEESLNRLYFYLSQVASKEDFIIPLIGTGNGRLLINREIIIKEIVLAFLSSLSQKNYAESLTVCIHKPDIGKHSINFTRLCEYLGKKIETTEFTNKQTNGSNAT